MNPHARQQQILEEARAFAREAIQPRAREFDQQGALDRGLILKLAEKGYLLASLPEDLGGLGLDPVHYGLLTEEIGKACCSTRALLTVQSSLIGETLRKWGTDEQRRRWLPLIKSGRHLGAFALSEPEIGTDARGVQTSYRRSGPNFVLNGQKKWTSFGDIASFFIVIAQEQGELSAFIVERATQGLTTRPMEGLLAGRAAHIAEVQLTEVTVPAGNMLGSLGSGLRYVAGTALDHGRYSIAWGSVAVAQACVDAMVQYARTRKQFGKRIAEFQMVQGMIADAVTKTHAARALCLRAGEFRCAGARNAVSETTIAKYFASRIAMEVATDAVQVHGGNGCADAYPVERLFREAKLLEIIEGTSQIQQQLIARFGLREYFRV